MRLPSRIGTTPQPASLVCPDCGGALSARVEEDAGYLEEVPGGHPERPAAAERLRAYAKHLRQMLDDSEPIGLGESAPAEQDPA